MQKVNIDAKTIMQSKKLDFTTGESNSFRKKNKLYLEVDQYKP